MDSQPFQKDNYSPEVAEAHRRKNKILFLVGLVVIFLLVAIISVAAIGLINKPKSEASNSSSSNTQQATVASSGYAVVDTNQIFCFDNTKKLDCLSSPLQDANYIGNQPSYTNNGDGTVTDNVTGLMWQKDPGSKVSYAEGIAGLSTFNLAGHNDWRVPTIKELYSLILFDGTDPSSCKSGKCSVIPFINNQIFSFKYGDTAAGERPIDSQFMSSTKYVSTTMNGSETVFGVNFADGRIKGYPTGKDVGGKTMKYYLLHVRGSSDYGKNNFDVGTETITDKATGLVWQKNDISGAVNWQDAIKYCQDLELAGRSDWRLPNAKELQSIVDYSRSPETTNSAAIDPAFGTQIITNEAGKTDWPYFWTSTTHMSNDGSGANAVYISFGRALGYMNGWIDVHGAGAQRSDPKTGSAKDYPKGHGPQGDAIRIYNHARCVSGGKADKPTSYSTNERSSSQIVLVGL